MSVPTVQTTLNDGGGCVGRAATLLHDHRALTVRGPGLAGRASAADHGRVGRCRGCLGVGRSDALGFGCCRCTGRLVPWPVGAADRRQLRAPARLRPANACGRAGSVPGGEGPHHRPGAAGPGRRAVHPWRCWTRRPTESPCSSIELRLPIRRSCRPRSNTKRWSTSAGDWTAFRRPSSSACQNEHSSSSVSTPMSISGWLVVQRWTGIRSSSTRCSRC